MTTDHLGSARVITNENGAVSSRRDYTAFGEESITAERHEDLGYNGSGDGVRKGYTGYEKDTESGLDFAQARYYNSVHGRFTSVDPLTASASIRNPQTFNRYSYVLNSPYKYVDPLGLIARSAITGSTEADGLDRRWTTKDCTKGCAIGGKWYEPVDFQNSPPPSPPPTVLEPVRDQAGTIGGFTTSMNNSPSKIGQTKGQDAAKALKRLGVHDIFFQPVTTPYFNKDKNRYVYTENGGWIDMVHFLFYAGKGYSAKETGQQHPIGSAVKLGYWQEKMDGEHSAYSYEDLPSDKFGADFAVNHFDPNSGKTLGEQINAYFEGKPVSGLRFCDICQHRFST